MKRTTKYVAFDVHQATTVASVREESGRVIARSVLPTDSGALTEFVRGMRGARHVTFEEGTQAQWLYELLAPLGDRVIVCDRRGAPRRGTKGDQVDADQLSEQLRRGALRAVYHGSADRVTLKELTRTYRNLVEDATRVMLRLKALFRARGIPASGKHVYHPRARAQWLAQLQDPGARLRAEALYAELDVLRHLRPRARAAMVTEAQRDPAWDARGTGASDAHSQARGAHAPALEERRTLRSDKADHASALKDLAPRRWWACLLAGGSRYQDEGAEGSLDNPSPPGEQSRRGTRLTLGPLRRTRRSVRPAPRRGPDRTVVCARAKPSCWQFVQVGPAA